MSISLEIRRKLSLAWFLSMYTLELVSSIHGHCSLSSISLNFCVSRFFFQCCYAAKCFIVNGCLMEILPATLPRIEPCSIRAMCRQGFRRMSSSFLGKIARMTVPWSDTRSYAMCQLAKITLHKIEPSVIGTLLSVQTLQTGQSIRLKKVIQWTRYRQSS